MRKSARAGPSGVRRPCSQFRNVWTLIPNAAANCSCVIPTKRLRETTSSPPEICPRAIRSRSLRGMAREKLSSLSSRILSAMSATPVCLESCPLFGGGHSRTQNAHYILLSLRVDHYDDAQPNGSHSDESVLRRIPFESLITLHNIRQWLSQSMADPRESASELVIDAKPESCRSRESLLRSLRELRRPLFPIRGL